jgi:translation elongation factor EF-Tu-like GTPase
MKNLINKIEAAQSAEQIELVSSEISKILPSLSVEDRQKIKEAVSKMHQNLMKNANILIEKSQNYLKSQGKTYDLSDWVTVKQYAKIYGIASTQVVSNWIRRGVVPKENIVEIGEFNNLKLIKAVPYQE